MKRLKAIEQAINDSGITNAGNVTCSVTGAEPEPKQERTSTGLIVCRDKYEAQVFVEDLSDHGYRLLRIMMSEFFRKNRVEGERFNLSTDAIDDVSNLVTIDLTLIDEEHISEDPAGEIEIDGKRYHLSDPEPEQGI